MPLEPVFNFIDDLDSANPNNSPDQVKEAANHLRGTKNAVKGSFPNLGQQSVTKTAAEINDLVQPATTDTLSNKTIDGALYIGTQSGFTGDVTGNLTGNVVGNSQGTHTGNVVGNASTATAFNSSRTITITGDASGSGASSNGSNTIPISLGNDTVRFSNEINNTTVNGAYVGPKTLAAGVFQISGFGNDGYGVIQSCQGLINGTWTSIFGTGVYQSSTSAIQVVSNGSNVRVTGAANAVFPYTKSFN